MLLLYDDLLSLVSPHICKRCGQVGSTYCSRCIFDVTKYSYPICVGCHRPCKTDNLCPACQKQLHYFDNIICIGERRGSLKRLIGDYKYNSELASCRPIADLLYTRLSNASSEMAIVPIPTISNHIRRRGFDHMLMVAKQLGRLTGYQVNSHLLYRTDNLSQHQQNNHDRRIKIKSSLAIKRGVAVPSRVLLLDDIWTTGATLQTAAALLKDHGVGEVTGCVVLRQPSAMEPHNKKCSDK